MPKGGRRPEGGPPDLSSSCTTSATRGVGVGNAGRWVGNRQDEPVAGRVAAPGPPADGLDMPVHLKRPQLALGRLAASTESGPACDGGHGREAHPLRGQAREVGDGPIDGATGRTASRELDRVDGTPELPIIRDAPTARVRPPAPRSAPPAPPSAAGRTARRPPGRSPTSAAVSASMAWSRGRPRTPEPTGRPSLSAGEPPTGMPSTRPRTAAAPS